MPTVALSNYQSYATSQILLYPLHLVSSQTLLYHHLSSNLISKPNLIQDEVKIKINERSNPKPHLPLPALIQNPISNQGAKSIINQATSDPNLM